MKANPPPLRIPKALAKDPETAGFLTSLTNSLFYIWRRSGGGEDFVETLDGEVVTLDAALTTLDTEVVRVAAIAESALQKDGSVTATGELPMGANKITGLADGVADTDAATKGQVKWEAEESVNFTAVASVTITIDPISYDEWVIEFEGAIPAVDGQIMYCRFGYGATPTIETSGGYDYVSEKVRSGVVYTNNGTALSLTGDVAVGSDTNEWTSGRIRLNAQYDSGGHYLLLDSLAIANNDSSIELIVATRGGMDKIRLWSAIQLYFASGNFEATGSYRVYKRVRTS